LEDQPRPRHVRRGVSPGGERPVDDDRPAPGQQDVRRLEIPVADAIAVGQLLEALECTRSQVVGHQLGVGELPAHVVADLG
jgi:hypothetical protein